MPEIDVQIGGRTFTVACQTGEEHFLQAAAKLLDDEASVLAGQLGRIPESRMLLMAGLMLADKTVGMEEELKTMETRLEAIRKEIGDLKSAPPEKVEVPVVPPAVKDSLADIAARTEALAENINKKGAA